jgi:predicted extracellular nuclease
MKKLVLLITVLAFAGMAIAQSPTGWVNAYPSNVQISQNSTEVNEGTYSVNVNCITQTQAQTEFISTSFDVTAGETYTATADVFDNDIAGKARIAVNFSGTNTWGDYSSDGTEWETLQATGTVPDGATTAYVFFRFYDITDDWDGDFACILDNVTFTLGSTPIDVTNAGFETWETLIPTEYTIEQIQDTTGTGTHQSAVVGEYVITSGIVTGIFDTFFTIENTESVDGKWSAIWVQNNGTSINLIDEVSVTGIVSESYGKTIINASDVEVTGQPDIALVPFEISTLDASDEAYEAVYIQCTGTCTNENPDESAKADFGEWLIDDGSGAIRVNDLGLAASFEPTLGYEYEVNGVINFEFSNFKIEPRTLSDITLIGAGTDPIINITSPANGATIASEDVNIAFTVLNFDVADGTADGHIMFTIDAETPIAYYTTDDIELTGLSEEAHTISLELVDNTGASLDPAVSASISFTIDLGGSSDYTSIYDIQYTTNASGDSPLEGSSITTRGVVSAIDGDKFWLQDGAGAWNSIYVFYNTTGGPAIGDSVIVTGAISEYFELTELTPTEITIVSSGNTVAAPTIVNTGDAGAEAYESVLVQVQGVNNSEVDNYGQWTVNDGSGNIFVDDRLFDYTPTQGNTYRVVGIMDYAFEEWKIEPRDADDIEDLGVSTDPLVSITSPANNANIYVNNVSVEFTVSNFTLNTDGKVAWNLDGGDNAYVTSSPIAITGLTEGQHTINLELVNMSEVALDPAVTASVTINVSFAGPTITPIYDIQYTTNADGNSPLVDQVVSVKGVVTASLNPSTYGKGYYIQDDIGAWSGLYIFDETNTPAIGDSVLVTGKITEYFGMTEMKNIESYAVVYIGGTIPAPIELTTATASSEEQYESVLVKVINAECLSGQSNGEWTINDGSGDALCKDNGAFDFNETIGMHYDIIGVIDYGYENYRINYRIASDIVEHTGISTFNGKTVRAYPNPASETITVEIPEMVEMVKILDINGKLVEEYLTSESTLTIDVNHLQAGAYFLKLEAKDSYSFIKITIE